jgi:hypothetical protein
MKVVTLGFSLESPFPEIHIANLMAALESKNGKADTSLNIERRIYVDSAAYKDFWVGLVVTVRDQKSFCRMENSAGNLVISVENLTKQQKVMEFNFFVINKKTKAGLYQQYHQSCSIGRFQYYLQANFRPLVTKFAEQKVKQKEKAKKLDDEERRKALRQYTKKLGFIRMCTKEKLDELMLQYQRVSAFEFEVATVVPDQHPSGAVPLARLSRKVRQKFSFKREAKLDDVVAAVVGAIKFQKIEKGQAFVRDYDGEAHTLKIFDMPEFFSEEEYDSVAEKLDNLNLQEFFKSVVLQAMMNTCKSPAYQHLFMQ